MVHRRPARGALQGAERDGYGFALVALTGGLLFVALPLAGPAIELVHPATMSRFANFQRDPQVGFVSFALSGWMYRFAFVGTAGAVIAATSLVVLRTEILPKWLARPRYGARRPAPFLRLRRRLAGRWHGSSSCSVLMLIGNVRRLVLAARPDTD